MNRRRFGLVGLCGELVAMGLLLAAAPSAWAHHDPPGCFGAGVDVDISVFRKRCSISITRACVVDADCPGGETCQFVGLTGPVAPCETIYYEGVLSKDPEETKCAFEGGTFKLVLPDGTTGAENNSVPCLGGTTSPCDPAVTQVVLSKVPYTVNIAPPTTITGNAIYTNGNTHDGGGAPNDDGDTIGLASGSQGFSNGVIACPDNDVCTTDTCDTAFVGSAACTHTPIVCTDNDPCTSDACNAVTGCFFTPGALDCNDNDPCTSDACVAGTGCVNTPGALDCNDNDPCTSDACVTGTGCVNTPGALDCNDNDPCTTDACVSGTGCVNTPGALDCNDNDPCTSDACVTGTGCVNTPGALDCNDNDPCTSDACVTGTGCVNTGGALDCNDNDVCTDDACVPGTGCVNTPDPSNDPSCSPVGCRITAGGVTPDGNTDLGDFAELGLTARHGGQVGAPCGCIGCFDEFDHIQGNWVHQRKKQKSNFKANDFNSLVCGCHDLDGGPGVFDGKLCNPGDRDPGPEPRKSPANIACFSGTGDLKRNGKVTPNVAFRVEVEDRSEPAAGQNSGPTPDVYRIRIWVPKGQETAQGLAAGACCTNPEPVAPANHPPDIDDGGAVTHGNIQIHPQIDAHIGECPVPGGTCSDSN